MNPSSDQKPDVSRRRFLIQAAHLGLFGALAAGLPALVPHIEEEGGTGADDDLSLDQERDRLEAARPDLVIIGDSMVPCRVDPRLLGELLGARVFLLYRHGSATAAWYLFFKNILCALPAPPARVVFFFRDTYFHLPGLRVSGDRARLIRALSVGREAELERVVSGRSAAGRKLPDAAARLLDEAYDLDGYNDEARDGLARVAFRLASPSGDFDACRRHLARVFDLKNLRHDLPDDLGDDDGDINRAAVFDPDPAAGFLPHLEKLAARHSVSLGFHRVRRRRHANPGYTDPPALASYLEAFRQWCARGGHAFTDESANPALVAGLFADGDHVRPEATALWTHHLAESLRLA